MKDWWTSLTSSFCWFHNYCIHTASTNARSCMKDLHIYQYNQITTMQSLFHPLLLHEWCGTELNSAVQKPNFFFDMNTDSIGCLSTFLCHLPRYKSYCDIYILTKLLRIDEGFLNLPRTLAFMRAAEMVDQNYCYLL